MKHILIILILCFSLNSFAQQLMKVDTQKEKAKEKVEASFDKRAAITIGLFQGGGSLIGADFEVLVGEKFGLQVGAGVVGFGASANYHFKPTIRSSFISLSYWHQGVGDATTQELLGPSYVFRGKKWFTFNAGLGFALSKGPAYPDGIEQSPVQLTFGVGIYFPM